MTILLIFGASLAYLILGALVVRVTNLFTDDFFFDVVSASVGILFWPLVIPVGLIMLIAVGLSFISGVDDW